MPPFFCTSRVQCVQQEVGLILISVAWLSAFSFLYENLTLLIVRHSHYSSCNGIEVSVYSRSSRSLRSLNFGQVKSLESVCDTLQLSATRTFYVIF